MNLHALRWATLRIALVGALVFFGAAIAGTAPVAESLPPDQPPSYGPQVDSRDGGVLRQSYQYHRGAAGATPGKWYGYGFPVDTYRWGWFGAERYYPHRIWHRGYYRDTIRWGYRRGY